MNHTLRASFALALFSFSAMTPAVAKDVMQPMQLASETLRYDQGEFTLDRQGSHGAVQVRPLPDDHGNMSFSVVVLNGSNDRTNIDVTNIRVEGTPIPVRPLSKDDMVKKAKSRAAWAAGLTALAGGLAAASAANQRDYYHATTFTPHGAYHTVVSAPCSTCQVEAAAIAAGTGYTLARIQGQLDETRRALGNDMLQLTTVDPGDSYGGRIFLTRFKHSVPSEFRLIVTVNGEDYPFGFRFVKKGTPAPEFKVVSANVQGPTPEQVQPETRSPAAVPLNENKAGGAVTASKDS